MSAAVDLAAHINVSTLVLVTGFHPQHSSLGIARTAITAAVMFALAGGKAPAAAALNNPVLNTEGQVPLIDGTLAVAVLLGLVLNAALGWWADPAAGYVLVYYAAREGKEIFNTHDDHPACPGFTRCLRLSRGVLLAAGPRMGRAVGLQGGPPRDVRVTGGPRVRVRLLGGAIS